MMIHADDLCKCGIKACGHTVGVFGWNGSDLASIEEIWANKNQGLLQGNCKKFIPLSNLQYLEYLYEQRK